MLTYHIVIDKIMLLNVIQTDAYEIIDLLGWEIFLFFFVFCIIPVFLIIKTEIIFSNYKTEIKTRVPFFAILIVLLSVIILPNSDTTKAFLKQNKYAKNYLVPSNYVGAVISVIKIKIKYLKYDLKTISEDAHFKQDYKSSKPNLIIVVIGESARAANFSFNGYERETNKPLDIIKPELINYRNFYSCGTSTAVSLPCIFSPYERVRFDPESAKYTENVLDILDKAGYKIIWRENNTDCKDNCNRIEIEKFCQTKECSDEVLLTNMAEKVKSTDKPTVIVMHQRGSHGPVYANRYPKEYEIYSPVCDDESLQNCKRQEMVNAYDNTIYYTSYVLKKIIEELKELSNNYNTAFVFTSDHGESLGENGIYLHSAYYDKAPKEQINVPMMFWFSDGYANDNNINVECLKNKVGEKYSHDNIFHTLIGMSGVSSKYYDFKLDMLSDCR
jgi:lipid A ethanolaminephosphotransferase